VEPAQEAKEPPPPDVVELCKETFQKTAEYLRGEMEGEYFTVIMIANLFLYWNKTLPWWDC